MSETDPSLHFLDTGSHVFLRRAWRSYPILRKDVRNAAGVALAQMLKSSRKRPDSPTLVHMRDGRRLRPAHWRELEYVTTSLCAIRGFLGRGDPQLLESLLKEREQVVAELEMRFAMEKRPVGAAGGGPGDKEVLLYLLVRTFKPKVVVETGVAHGVTSRYILRAMSEVGQGKLVSVDLPPYQPGGYDYADGRHDPTYVPQDLGVGWLVPPELRSRWELRLGRSSDELPKVEGPVDVFFHDSEHSYKTMMDEYVWGDQHLAPGGFLGTDDLPWSTAWTDFHAQRTGTYRVLTQGNIGLSRKGPTPTTSG